VYTVRQLAELAGISTRTLHYYDEIGLLKPTWVGENGYRYYGEDAVLRLQQILFFREMDLKLARIRQIMDSPSFDLVAALRAHRDALQDRISRLQNLIATVDNTIMHLVGEVEMSQKGFFAGFDEEQQKKWTQEAIELYGEENVRPSVRRWESYTPEQKQRIQEEGNAIYRELAERIGEGPESEAVQALIARWHEHLRYFYEPSVERLRGLGQLYNGSPDFRATFEKFHPDLPAFLEQAITHYCDHLAGEG
jgi:DNA-binding transcriptional MerR regulator